MFVLWFCPASWWYEHMLSLLMLILCFVLLEQRKDIAFLVKETFTKCSSKFIEWEQWAEYGFLY
jgi:hypothetical protein